MALCFAKHVPTVDRDKLKTLKICIRIKGNIQTKDGIVHKSIEKRRSPRIELDYFKVRLEWCDSQGLPRSQTASCVDISRHGVSFECPFPFEIGSAVSVTFNYDTDVANQVIGSVCRCSRLTLDNFHVALQIKTEDSL